MVRLSQGLGIALFSSSAMGWGWDGDRDGGWGWGHHHHHHHDHDVLQHGSPGSVGMDAEVLREMERNLSAYAVPANYGHFTHDEVHPVEPGGATIVGRKNTIVNTSAFGKRLQYADANGTELPSHEQEDATVDTIYDMASLTKLFTTVAVLRQIDAGKVALHETVATYVPDFASNGKSEVTIQMLLTHTSGLAPDPKPPLYFEDVYPTYDDRIHAILHSDLENEPGTVFVYSDINFMTLMIVLETVTGCKLDDLVHDYTSAMGMESTFFNRGNVEGDAFHFYNRMAAEEFQIEVLGETEPQRPQPVRGTVHDENAWSLDGVSGHAGLFSTVEDSAKFCQMILNNGTYNGHQILSQESVDLIFTNLNADIPDARDHGAGFELDQYYTAGPLASQFTASHTGYTGTSLVVDREHDLFFLHFSNRVHPTREWSSNNIVREAVGYWVGTSLGLDLDFPSL